VRKSTALIAAIALLAGLTACSSGTSVAGCIPAIGSGSASSVVTAKGKLGSAPKIDFPTPLFTAKSEQSVIIPGKGAPIQAGQPVVLDVTIANGADGSQLQKTSYSANGGSIITVGTSSFPAVSLGLECAQVGSRIAIVGSAKDSHGGVADQANGIAKNDSFVYVVDVKQAFLAKANGADQIPTNGNPAVVLTDDGTPGVTVPDASAPKSTSVSLLKAGSGAKVKNQQFVIVKYTGLAWTSRAVFDSTWSKHQASILQTGSASVSSGLSKALVGKRVGSQVLAVLTPKDAAVADGSGKAPADDDAVYVVDILGVAG
jgi:peptidylprolyl isomerase